MQGRSYSMAQVGRGNGASHAFRWNDKGVLDEFRKKRHVAVR